MTAAPPEPAVRLSIPGVQVVARLSTGGMGSVLLARRLGAHGFERLIAVKTVRADLAGRDDIRRMFFDEARLLARLDHPAIVQVHDFGETGDLLYLTMEYVAGVTFAELVEQRGPLPQGVAARLAAEVARGLHAAHELTDLQGRSLWAVHRDVSPQNLLLTFDGHVKIVDFGIALMRDRTAPVTLVGFIKGKPAYMAPEQLRGDAVDRRADVYALGAVLVELLTGRALFGPEAMLAVARGQPADSHVARALEAAALPPSFAALAGKALSPRPEDRFQDAHAMAVALDAVAAAEGAEPIGSFALRELSREREAHRTQLQALLSDGEARAGPAVRPRTLVDLRPEPETLPAGGPETPKDSDQIETRLSRPMPRPEADRETRLVGSAPQSESEAGRAVRRSRGPMAVAALAGFGVLAAAGAALWPRDEEVTAPATPAVVPAAPAPSTLASEVVEVAASAKEPPRAKVRPRPAAEPRLRKAESAAPPAPESPAGTPPETPAGPPGELMVGAEPFALVRIDGREAGVTPLTLKLAPGPHEVLLVSPESGEVRLRRPITLAPGEHRRITVP
ncbi:MAG: serine/threonine protein kinase [Myxococcales bacterium]|nr:serine/threonine protein kinase [Myxococcales bacterium]